MKQVIARAQITITSVYDGADAYNVFLSANALTIPCNADGSDPVLLAARSTVTVMQAGTDITKNCTLTLLTRLNCSAVLSGSEIIITKIDTAQTAGYVEIAVTTPPVNGKKATTNHRLNWSLSRQGTTGADGPPGPSLTSAGYWQKDKVYYMRPDVRTRVIYRVDGKNYLTKQNKVVTAIPMGTLPSDARYWSVFDGQFELVATNVLFAEEAYIGQVNTPAIWIGSGIKGWKIDKEQIESVQQVNGIPKTRLTSNGDIEVTGGSLRILSGTASQSIHEYTKQQLDSVQIGGRNLLRNSNFADAKEYWGTNGADSWTIEKDESFGNILKVKTSVVGRGIYQSITTPRQTGENYTISVYLKADAAMKVLLGHEGGTGSKVVDVTSQWQRYTTQGVWTAGGAVTFYARETGAFYIANAQYEQGNRTTAWTPAVEDIDSQIQDAQNKISQAQNDANKANSMIADIASDDKLTPAEKQATKKEWEIIVSEYQRNIAQSNKFGISAIAYTDAYNALRSYITPLLDDLNTLSDIDGTTFRATFKTYYDARTDLLNAIVSKTKEWAEKAQATADQAGSDARKVRSEYKADLVVVNDKIAAKVSQSDFNALGKRLSTTQSNVSQLAGSITSVVEKVDNIKIGGRNLLRNSNFADTKNHWGTNGADSWTIEKDASFGNVSKVKTSVIGRGIFQSILTQRQVGANYTISVYLKADKTMKIRLGHEGGTGSKVVDVTSQWQRYTTQGVWKTKGSLTFYGQETGMFYIANVQYEQGNQTTAWTPAPEDVQTEINTLYSKINQTADEISLTVGKLKIGSENLLKDSSLVTVDKVAGQGAKLVFSVDMIQGETYTLSYESTNITVANNYPQFFIWESENWTKIQNLGNITAKSRTFKFALPTGKYTFTVYNHHYPVAGVINKIKLEKGNIATAWTPAREDVQVQIDSKTTLEEVKAGIKITTDGVEAFGNAFRINGALLAHLIKTDGLDVGNGNFVVEKDGKVTMNDATVRGRFESNKNGDRIIINPEMKKLSLISSEEKTVGSWSFGYRTSEISLYGEDTKNKYSIGISPTSINIARSTLDFFDNRGMRIGLEGIKFNIDSLKTKKDYDKLFIGEMYRDGEILKIRIN